MKHARFGFAVAALALGSFGLLATTSPGAAEDLSLFRKRLRAVREPTRLRRARAELRRGGLHEG